MRYKIWELGDLQCSVVGTCLSLKELRKLARQTRMTLDPGASEFTVHAAFVAKCKEENGVEAKAVNKALDKKFAAALRRCNAAAAQTCSDAALAQFWTDARQKGDIPGPYWAIMTHPATPGNLREKVFGDVHMLSHLVGASNRADIRRLADLERELERANERQNKARTVYRNRFKQLREENRTLSSRLREQAKEAETLRFGAKDHCTEAVYLENQALQRSLAAQSAMLAQQQAKYDALERRFCAYAERMEHMEEELREKQAEIDFLEKELQQHLDEHRIAAENCSCSGECDKAATAHCQDQCPSRDLSGKRILYVGGRANLAAHYRHAVERRGGVFLHHDGGVEQARQILPKLLNSVDAVLCPVDCVSHDACQCVKEVCKHTMKPCKMLRSSGLSSLVRSLEELVTYPHP